MESRFIIYIDMDDVLYDYSGAHKKASDANPVIAIPSLSWLLSEAGSFAWRHRSDEIFIRIARLYTIHSNCTIYTKPMLKFK